MSVSPDHVPLPELQPSLSGFNKLIPPHLSPPVGQGDKGGQTGSWRTKLVLVGVMCGGHDCRETLTLRHVGCGKNKGENRIARFEEWESMDEAD